MAYRFKLSEAVAVGASRIGLEQIDLAEARLTSHDDPAAAIHDARRCLKRLRALLRLIRPALADSVYRREAKRLAGIGRLLADVRDQHVMQQTLAKLESRFDTMPRSVAGKLAKLRANGEAGRPQRGSASAGRREALQGLEAARVFFARLAKRSLTFEHLASGVEKSYRRSRRAFREAYDNGTDETFHEWRKTVQQHWRHMQLISRAWPDVLSGRADEAKELSRLLGDDHDIHVLISFATDKAKASLTRDELMTLVKLGRSLQKELRAEAKPRGARLFAEPAANLRERMEFYWLAARDLANVSPGREDKRKAPVKRPRHAARNTAAAAHAASRGPVSGARRSGR